MWDTGNCDVRHGKLWCETRENVMWDTGKGNAMPTCYCCRWRGVIWRPDWWPGRTVSSSPVAAAGSSGLVSLAEETCRSQPLPPRTEIFSLKLDRNIFSQLSKYFQESWIDYKNIVRARLFLLEQKYFHSSLLKYFLSIIKIFSVDYQNCLCTGAYRQCIVARAIKTSGSFVGFFLWQTGNRKKHENINILWDF